MNGKPYDECLAAEIRHARELVADLTLDVLFGEHDPPLEPWFAEMIANSISGAESDLDDALDALENAEVYQS
jgi:hypothetical protein